MAASVIVDGFVDISKDLDGGCLKKILVEGSGDGTPPPGSKVFVHYVGTLQSDGTKFDSSRDRPGEFDFDVGVGQVIKGWDVGICSMRKGEKAILRCSSNYAYGDEGSPPKIPGGATLDFEVELFGWREKTKEPHDMSPEQRSKMATQWKNNGNDAFARQAWEEADDCYYEGIRYITFTESSMKRDSLNDGKVDIADATRSKPELNDEDTKLAVALLSNCAAAKMKMNGAEAAVRFCSRALEFDESNVKALFRRAQAQLTCANYEEAIADVSRVLELDSRNAPASQLLVRAEREKQIAKKKEKAVYSKMFG